MRVMLTNRNQITIPKNMINELGLELGKYYEMNITKDSINLDITKSYDALEDEKPIEIIKSEEKPSKNIKIESNLEEGKTFSRQVYSECGLVIRTKSSYMRKFCEACQGQLAQEYGIDNHPCKYLSQENKSEDVINIKEEPRISSSKKIIDQLTDNVKRLNKNINTKITNISKECP